MLRGKPRSLEVSLLHSLHRAAGTTVCEPCVTWAQSRKFVQDGAWTNRALSAILLRTLCVSRRGHWSVTLVQCHFEHQRKPRGGVRTVPQLGPQRAFRPLPSESFKWELFGAGRHFIEVRPDGVT